MLIGTLEAWRMSAFGTKQTCGSDQSMSAFGGKQTSRLGRVMSALTQGGPKADIGSSLTELRLNRYDALS